MKKFLTLFSVAALTFAAQADVLTVADGTAQGEYAPVYGYNFETDQHNQIQYPATELAGMEAGAQISALTFYTSTPDLVNALGGSVTISLANLNEATPWSVDGYGYISGDLLNVDMTAVATVTPQADAEGAWTITFNTPFTYTGGTLLMDVQTTAGTYKDTYFYGKEMGAYYVMSVYGYSGSQKGQTILPKVDITVEGSGAQTTAVTLLSEANALEDNSAFTFNGDAVVTVCNAGYVLLRDASGYGLICGVEGTFENGQVLSQGWNATKSTTIGWDSFTDATGLSASGVTNTALAAAQKITGGVDESMVNAYVYIENVNKSFLPVRSLPLPNGSTISITDQLWAGNQPASGKYNVYGIICNVNGTLMFNLVAWEKYVEPQAVRGDVDGNNACDMDDLSLLINYLLNDSTPINQAGAAICDSLTSTTVDMDDLSAMINYLLTNSWGD